MEINQATWKDAIGSKSPVKSQYLWTKIEEKKRIYSYVFIAVLQGKDKLQINVC